jgi:hypothetical protein
MRFRKLRIVWSVVWGVAAMLLIVLWVRSYWSGDTVYVAPTPTPNFVGCYSIRGQLTVDAVYGPGRGPLESKAWRWGISSRPQQQYQESTVRKPQHSELGFSSFSDTDYLMVSAPHWFPIVILGGVATLPWAKHRFSLHTLLIATTLVAVALGLAVWSIH